MSKQPRKQSPLHFTASTQHFAAQNRSKSQAKLPQANVVGYANKTWDTAGKFKMTCSQFQVIGKDATQMVLGDLVPGGEWVIGEDFVKVFNDNSSVKYNAVYFDEDAAAALRDEEGMDWVTAGWYDTEKDEELHNNLNNEPLPLGGTVMAISSEIGAYLTSAGEVIESETGMITFEWAAAGKFKMVGNCTPKDLTLGDYVPGGEWVIGEDFVKVFNDNSSVKYNAVYFDEDAAAALRDEEGMDWVTAGWYDTDKDEELHNNLNNEPIPAGSGVMAISSEVGATLSIPSAL